MKHKATRSYGFDWSHQRNEDGSYGYDAVHAILLQEIRDELQHLNRFLNCKNLLEIPELLRAIKRNTTKPKRKGGGRGK